MRHGSNALGQADEPAYWRRSCAADFPHGAAGRGFSLIELLVVLALLLIVTTLYWGSSTRGPQRTGLADCQQNLQKIHVALEIYANEHGSAYPVLKGARTSAEALATLVPRYTSDTSIFVCPGSKDAVPPVDASFSKHSISYAYYMGRSQGTAPQVLMSDRQLDTLAKTPSQPLFSSTGKGPGNNHGRFGGNLLFSDGHVERAGPAAPCALPVNPGETLLNP